MELATAPEIVAVLKKVRFNISTEKDVQGEMQKVFERLPYTFIREHILDSHSTIDFYIHGIGIEVKIKGAKSAIFKQLERYAAFTELKSLIVVTSRAMAIPADINGKPVYVVNMSTAWL